LYLVLTSGVSEMTEKSEAVVAKNGSFVVAVEAGKTYMWCACGRSSNQPFCDGAHSGTSFSPVAYEAKESKNVGFCGCKHSGNKPLCDGSHKNL
jgi:CDGSH-type Zn-finger protein